MPYTKDSKERPRKDQIEVPKNIGEYTLALTVLGLEYIKKNGESYAHYTHCMNAFMPGDEGSVCRFNYEHIDDAIKLREMANWITQNYKNRVQGTPKQHEVTGAKMCCMIEFYRRMVIQYENVKLTENGDVFPKEHPEDKFHKRLDALCTAIEILTNKVHKLEPVQGAQPIGRAKPQQGFFGKKAKKIEPKEDK